MGFNLSLFKTPKHRVFNYQPLYYDEKKEAMEERHARLREEEKGKEQGYIPGRLLRGNLRRAVYQNRRGTGSVILNRIIIMAFLIILLFAAYYLAKSFGLFFAVLG
ncbi:MAG: hypothetical protein ABFC28_07060 [Rikenellaceae bacterium]